MKNRSLNEATRGRKNFNNFLHKFLHENGKLFHSFISTESAIGEVKDTPEKEEKSLSHFRQIQVAMLAFHSKRPKTSQCFILRSHITCKQWKSNHIFSEK